MSDAVTSPQTDAIYAWCFDHGRLHRFLLSEGCWCTAAWVQLTGSTEEEAMESKQLIWGEAQFFDQLDLIRQGGLLNMSDSRERLLKSRPKPVVEEL